MAYKLLAGDPHRLDDVMQEAYVKAYRSLHRFRVDAELRMVVLHRLQRLQRRAAPSATPPTTVDVSAPALDRATSAAGPERAVDAADQARRALSALPEDQRSTVVLVDGEGFDNLTAAEILGVAPGTVASRLSRARVTMRRILDEAQP
ncbi:MAG: RNA polymerase sigma factor [Actinomycetota bacterium]|nr:RNA polymerase sigma factor [Actinomycetota bacterium]